MLNHGHVKRGACSFLFLRSARPPPAVNRCQLAALWTPDRPPATRLFNESAVRFTQDAMLRLSALRGLKRVSAATVKFPTPSSSSSSATARARLRSARNQSSVPMQDLGVSAASSSAAGPDVVSVANQRVIGYWLLGMGGLVAGMVTIGGVTRLTRSGLSMTDWKLQGSLPPMTREVRCIGFVSWPSPPLTPHAP